ncbi:MAG TPA: hypothetical protein VKU44_02600 [Terriglobia bacterium]|nr:hypothetical protein [Terriglobia bacterium]
MAEKTQGPGHAMFGLNQPETRKPAPEPAPAAPPAAAPAPGSPQVVYVQAPPPVQAAPSAGGVRLLPALVALLFIVGAVNLYLTVTGQQRINQLLSKQADDLNLLTRRMNTSDELYSELQGKFQVTTEKLGLTEKELSRAQSLATDTQKQLSQSNERLSQAIAKKASSDELNKAQAESNAKITGVANDLEGTRKDLAGTRKDLESALAGTKGELSGAIARTHDELVELAHRTDRDYFEFNLERKGAKQKVGTVAVELERTNPKKNQFSVYLYFDDKRAERKDKAINEPVYFYMQGAQSALELVVNKVNKNGITGYISAPKGFIANTPNVLAARPGA